MAATAHFVETATKDNHDPDFSVPLFRLRRSCHFEDIKERTSPSMSPTSIKVQNRSSLEVTRKSGTLSRLLNRNGSIHRSQSTTLNGGTKKMGKSASLVEEDDMEYTFRRNTGPEYASLTKMVSIGIETPTGVEDELKFVEYGDDWSSDVVVLPHNALRSELRDLVVVVRALHTLGNTANHEDIAVFCRWWSTFASFGIEYFDYEEQVLFPHVISAVNFAQWSQLWSAANILKRSILEKFQALDTAVEDLRQGNRDALGRLGETRMIELSDAMLKYFAEEESIIPPAFHEHLLPAVGKKIHTRMAEHFTHSENSREHLIILTYWMRHRPSVLQGWCSENLPLSTRLSYPRWKRKFEHKHRGAITKLERRVSSPALN